MSDTEYRLREAQSKLYEEASAVAYFTVIAVFTFFFPKAVGYIVFGFATLISLFALGMLSTTGTRIARLRKEPSDYDKQAEEIRRAKAFEKTCQKVFDGYFDNAMKFYYGYKTDEIFMQAIENQMGIMGHARFACRNKVVAMVGRPEDNPFTYKNDPQLQLAIEKYVTDRQKVA